MKRLLILMGLMFFCIMANADAVVLKPYFVAPLKFAFFGNAVIVPVKHPAHNHQVGMTVHLSSIPEAYWDKNGSVSF